MTQRENDIIGRLEQSIGANPYTGEAIQNQLRVEAAAEIAQLRAALKQALRQWAMYAEMVERPVDASWNLATEKSPEGDLYRAAHALANEQIAPGSNDPDYCERCCTSHTSIDCPTDGR